MHLYSKLLKLYTLLHIYSFKICALLKERKTVIESRYDIILNNKKCKKLQENHIIKVKKNQRQGLLIITQSIVKKPKSVQIPPINVTQSNNLKTKLDTLKRDFLTQTDTLDRGQKHLEALGRAVQGSLKGSL